MYTTTSTLGSIDNVLRVGVEGTNFAIQHSSVYNGIASPPTLSLLGAVHNNGAGAILNGAVTVSSGSTGTRGTVCMYLLVPPCH